MNNPSNQTPSLPGPGPSHDATREKLIPFSHELHHRAPHKDGSLRTPIHQAVVGANKINGNAGNMAPTWGKPPAAPPMRPP